MEVMLDLESMSTDSNAAIVSIGAVRFDLDAEEYITESTFYRVVNLKSVQRAGGIIDADTVMWWLMQSEAARKTLTGDNSLLIETVLKEFNTWIREKPLKGIWGNGSHFDNVALNNTYRRLSWTAPWSFKQNRCYRTISALFPQIGREQFRTGTYHNAVDDAVTQAKHLHAIWKSLKK